jgi:hypothetical protein
MSQHQTRQDKGQEFNGESEISLIDILRFLRDAYKTILVFGVVGIVIAVGNLANTPKQYEAIAQISMAQIGIAANNNSLVINVEDPPLLIARLSQPTGFTQQAITSCGIKSSNPGTELSKSIKLAQYKAVSNMVELKTYSSTPEGAFTCAQAIFEHIKTTQEQIVSSYTEEAKLKLADSSQRLATVRDILAKADNSGAIMGAVYLSTRDEIRFLLDEIAALKSVVNTNQSRTTRLVAPIYASDTPITLKKRVPLVAGLIGGLLLGLMLALSRMIWIKLKADL